MPNVAKLLLFQKPLPAPVHTAKQNITLTIGKERYAMTIHTKIERVTAQPMGRPPPDFPVQPGNHAEHHRDGSQGCPHAPDVAPRAGKTRNKATRSE